MARNGCWSRPRIIRIGSYCWLVQADRKDFGVPRFRCATVLHSISPRRPTGRHRPHGTIRHLTASASQSKNMVPVFVRRSSPRPSRSPGADLERRPHMASWPSKTMAPATMTRKIGFRRWQGGPGAQDGRAATLCCSARRRPGWMLDGSRPRLVGPRRAGCRSATPSELSLSATRWRAGTLARWHATLAHWQLLPEATRKTLPVTCRMAPGHACN